MMRPRNDEREVPAFSASAVLNEIGEALTAIRIDDKLTFADLGAELGKSDDQAAKYCAGSAAMDVVTYARAKRRWNGRFTGGVDRLCQAGHVSNAADRARQNKVLAAALALSIALEDDDQITPEEVRANRATIENARDALDELLRKLVRAA